MKNLKPCVFLCGAVLGLSFALTARAATFVVTESNFAFSPSTLTIGQGDSVKWTNSNGSVTHSSASGTAPSSPNGLWNFTNSPATSHTVSFAGFAAGTYPYFCTFHGGPPFNMVGSLVITNTTVAPPSVTITNPADGTRFAAPANIRLMASATQSGGTITNVQFRSGAAVLGSAGAAPFEFTFNSAPAGNYAFTAVAMNDQGASATSAVVNVFVETNAVLSNPAIAGGHFQLTINGVAGQTYATESSSNLTDWLPVGTNVAPSGSFQVTDPSPTNGPIRFYRARQNL